MNAEFLRAQQLFSLGRWADAGEACKRSIAQDAEFAAAYALLALCLSHRQEHEQAQAVAGQAVACDPEDATNHYVRAVTLFNDRRYGPAEETLQAAIRLDPDDADHFGLLAACRGARNDWEGVLKHTGTGLAIDPEHQQCIDLRSHALTRLGRRDEAAAVIKGALARNPENAAAHANIGWAALHGNRPAEALGSFEEALRLDPENDFARAGLVEALKARNPAYRLVLMVMLWLGRLSDVVRWAIVLGGFVLHGLVGDIAYAYPATAWVLKPLWWAYLVFVVLTWLSDPLFNMILWLHPRGRYALNPRQRTGAAGTALLIAVALGGVVWYALAGKALGLLIALLAAMLGAHINSALQTWNPRHRQRLVLAVCVLCGMALASILLIEQEQLLGARLFTYTFYGWLAYMFLHAHLSRSAE